MELSAVQWSFLILLLGSCCNPTVGDESAYKLVCYYTNWAIYRPSLAKYTPENINPYLCTHLIYAFGGLSTRFEIKPFDSYNDIQQGNYKKFVDLKRHNPKLKTMIAVGGWNEGSKKFSSMVSDADNRHKFVQSAMKFLRLHKFDGLDLDWEYPTFRDGSSPDDKEGYLELVRELRDAFENEKLRNGAERLLLTMAVPAGQQYIEQGYDIPALAKELDFFNLLTYDYYTTQEGYANHHSALFGVDDELESWDPKRLLNVDWTVNFYLELGAPPSKLVVGVPSYGRAFKLEDPEDSALGALISGAAEAGLSTREEGYLAYYEICKKIEDDEWKVKRPYPDEVGPYAYKGDQWVGYDDEAMVIRKAKYVVEHKLGGVMFWALDTDDFRGQCGGEKSPLITAARKVLLSASVTRSTATKTTKVVTTTRRAIPKRKPTTTIAPKTTTFEDTDDEEEVQIDGADDETNIDVDFNIDEEEEEEEPVSTKKHKNRLNERSDLETSSSCRSGTRGRGRHEECEDDDDDDDAFRTPPPPTTPDPGPQFDCKDEGFFPNPSDCRKYFWCLDSGPADLGIVPNHFTCPSGLHFNTFTDSCDYPNNVNCKIKSTPTEPPTTKRPKSRTTRRPRPAAPRRTTTESAVVEVDEEELSTVSSTSSSSNPNIAQLLHLIEKLGGVEEVQKHLSKNPQEEEEVATTARQSIARTKTTAAPAEEEEEETPSRNADDKATSDSPFRRGSARHRTATKATTITELPSTSSRPLVSRRRMRQKTTTTSTEQATDASRGTAGRRQTAARSRSGATTLRGSEEEVSDSTLRSTLLKIPAEEDPEEMEARIDDTKLRSNSDSESFVGDGYETFGATRIPGLFKYVPLRRQTSTESALDITAQIRRILDSASEPVDHPKSSALISNNNSNEDETINFEVTAKESTNNIQIAHLDKIPDVAISTLPITTTNSPPFENIGVRLEKEITARNHDSPIFDQDNEGTITEEQIEISNVSPLGVSIIGETEEETEQTPGTTTTTTTTTEAQESTTKVRVPIRRIVMKTRQRTRKTTSTTSTTSAKPFLEERISTARSTTTVRPSTPSMRRHQSQVKFRTTVSPSTPDPNNPLSLRIRYNRRPGSQTDDSFQGLSVKPNGDLDCLEQGVYPHPIECNKFVSCVSIQGSIRSWTYVCPNQEMYDDFTGRCLDAHLVECQLL